MTYEQIIENKRKAHVHSGFDVNTEDLPNTLFPFQKFCVQRALKAGKYALFEDCGLGKTRQQLLWADEVCKHTGKPVLVLAPLAVVGQTIEEANKIGIYILSYESTEKDIADVPDIVITNYEQIDNIDFSIFAGIVLDESSILKNFEGAYRNGLIEKCKDIPYKLCCTATPSPNDPDELGNHAEFLDIMKFSEMRAMYFTHDGGETSKWILKGHAQDVFWKFVATWSIMLCKPADIGFEMEGYNLPELNFVEHVIKTEHKGVKLFNTTVVNATNFNAELRNTKKDRIAKVLEILKTKPDEQFIVWIKQNEEGEMLSHYLSNTDGDNYTSFAEVTGSDTNEYKKDTLLEFADKKFRVLITKLKIGSMGLNFQNCHNQIFASLDFSFEGLYQGIRRSYRFGQQHAVNIYIVTTDTMENVIASIKQKQIKFETMQHKMSEFVIANLHLDKKDYIASQSQQMQLPSWIKEYTASPISKTERFISG